MKNKSFPNYDVTPFSTLLGLLNLSKEKYGTNVLFRIKRRKLEEVITYNQFCLDVERLSSYLIEKYGTNNKITLLGENSYFWVLSYFAIICSSNIAVPIDKELSPDDIAELMSDCKSVMMIFSDLYSDIVDKLSDMHNVTDLIAMSSIVEILKTQTDRSTSHLTPLNPDQLAIIAYTSGTTGRSKGVMLSQRNICSDIISCCQTVLFYGRTLAFLPFHHTFAMLGGIFVGIYYGVEIQICQSMKSLLDIIRNYKPTYLIVVPIIANRLADGLQSQMNRSCKRSFRQVRSELGGELDFIVSGGAALDRRVVDWFMIHGITLLNGYGITECSPVVSVNSIHHHRSGSIGQPINNVHVRIDQPNEAGDGEICVSGDNIMMGYYNMPEETECSIIDGWFHTGDIGHLDKDGYLYITGRIKNLIILENGKNVSPEELEDKIMKIPGVSEAIVYEDTGRLVAEILPVSNTETEMYTKNYFIQQIHFLNTQLPTYKAIAKVTIRTTEFEKTSTQKVKRHYN